MNHNMPKISKKQTQANLNRKEIALQKTQLKMTMYKSALFTFLLAALMLVISFLFNGRIISSWVQNVENVETTGKDFYNTLDIIIRTVSVVLFFLFCLISIGNLQELRGYVVTWKEMVVLIVLSLIQTTISGAVFALSLLGIVVVLVYMYFIQGKIEQEIEY